MSTIVDYEGKLAVDFGGWQTRLKEPIQDRLLRVSNIPVTEWPRLVGQNIVFSVNLGRVYNPGTGQYVSIPTEDWERVLLERPVKKPRRGKNYDWEWSTGEWRKVWK